MITTISEHNLPAAQPRLSRATDPKMREFKELLRRAGLRPTHAERRIPLGCPGCVERNAGVRGGRVLGQKPIRDVFGTSTKQTAPRGPRVEQVPAPGVGIDRWPGRRPETTEGTIGWTSRNSNES